MNTQHAIFGKIPLLGSAITLFLISGLVGMVGCSTGDGRSQLRQSNTVSRPSTSELTLYHDRLVQNGKFSEAAMLSGLHDSSNWDATEDDVVILTEKPLDVQDKPKPEIEETIEPSEKPLNAYLTHVPTGDSPKTSSDGKWHARLGWSLMVNGNHDGAAAAYREAIRQNDTLAEAYLGFGILLKLQGNPNAAVEAYQKALTLKPQYAAALVHLGYAYADGHLGQRDLAKAKRLFHRASKQGDPFAIIALIDLKTRN